MSRPGNKFDHTDARRIITALGRHAACGDPEELAELAALHATVDHAIVAGIRGQRAAGIRWESIGAALGVTRQAALMRWGPKIDV